MMPHPVDRERGFLLVCPKTGGSYLLNRCERERLATALERNREGGPGCPHWYEGEDNYGTTIRIELASIEAVLDNSPAAVERKIADGFWSDDEEQPWNR